MVGGMYEQSLALLTHSYQLTMAAAAWKSGMEDREPLSPPLSRRPPFEPGSPIAAGLATALEYIGERRFADDDLRYLRELRADSGEPMFEPAFLDHLRSLELGVDVDAVPEGTAVFPQEPLLRVCGPIVPCMLLETPLLDLINFQTLIATKAARVCLAAQGEPVIEFGLRRAQGIDGAVSAARAAYIGGGGAPPHPPSRKPPGKPPPPTPPPSSGVCSPFWGAAVDATAPRRPHQRVPLLV